MFESWSQCCEVLGNRTISQWTVPLCLELTLNLEHWKYQHVTWTCDTQQDKSRPEGVTHNDCSLDSLPSKTCSRKVSQLTHRKQMTKFKNKFVGKAKQELKPPDPSLVPLHLSAPRGSFISLPWSLGLMSPGAEWTIWLPKIPYTP